MESSDDDTPLQVLAESAGWEDPIAGEREAFENFVIKGSESSVGVLGARGCNNKGRVL